MAKKQTTRPDKAKAKVAAPSLSPAALDTPSAEKPAEVSGVFPPQAIPFDGELPPEIVVGSEASMGDEEPPTAPELHPTIAQAQRYKTGHGKPMAGYPRYYTAPPPDLRTRAQREQDERSQAKR